MKSALYWLIATTLLALVVHLFVVIFVPGVDTGQKMAQLAASGDINTLHSFRRTSSGSPLLTEPNPDLVYAYCKFDVSSGPLLVQTPVPQNYWSVSVYTETAENIYTLNDMQAGVPNVRLLIVQDAELRRYTTADETGARTIDAIVVGTPSDTGLVLVRAFAGEASVRPAAEAQIATSSCAPYSAPPASETVPQEGAPAS